MIENKYLQSQQKLVLIHGIFDTSAVLKPLKLTLEKEHFKAFAPDLTPCNGKCSIKELAKQLQRFIELSLDEVDTFSLIGFSMGGLIARYYLQNIGSLDRVNCLITIGTPHNGSALAFLRIGEGFKELRQGSAFLNDLKASEEKLSALKPLSIYTPFDLMIVPYTSSIWTIAENVAIPVSMHCGLLASPMVHRAVVNRINHSHVQLTTFN